MEFPVVETDEGVEVVMLVIVLILEKDVELSLHEGDGGGEPGEVAMPISV